jgi:hypothetical protein
MAMGTWSFGNFDNDDAADHIAEIGQQLIGQIKEIIANDSKLEPDEPESAIVLCNMEILCCLVDGIKTRDVFLPLGPLPTGDTVKQWKEKYLTIWDSYIDGLAPDKEYKQLRHQIISETFDRFLFLVSYRESA